MRRLLRYLLLQHVAAVAASGEPPPEPPAYSPALDLSDHRNSQYFLLGYP